MKQLFFKKRTSYQPLQQQKPLPSLGMCLLMDFLGVAFLAIPFLGPFVEILFAPISAYIYMRMFGGVRGFFGGIFNFIEELIPGLDFIPTFTITWMIQYSRRKKESLTLRPITR
jgi:hypothetical protein